MNNLISGTGIAIITPFKENYSIDYISFRKIIEHICNSNVNFIIVAGTTGESSLISDYERCKIFDFIANINNNRLKLIACIGGNNTKSVIKMIKNFHLSKYYKAILSISPYYNKPSQDGIIIHYKKIAEVSKLPIIIYNIPHRTSINILVETIIKLSEIPNIIGIKESNSNVINTYNIINKTNSNFLFFSGDETLSLSDMALGANGIISVIGNAYPNLVSDMINKCLKNNFIDAKKIYNKLMKITSLIFQEGNPSGIKELMYHLNFCTNIVRLPLTKVSYDLSNKIKKTIKNDF